MHKTERKSVLEKVLQVSDRLHVLIILHSFCEPNVPTCGIAFCSNSSWNTNRSCTLISLKYLHQITKLLGKPYFITEQLSSGQSQRKRERKVTSRQTNSYSTNFPLLYSLKNLKNRFSDVFRGYRSRTLVRNGLKNKNNCDQSPNFHL